MADTSEAGDIQINKADLYSFDGNRKANILLQIFSVNIFENILKPTIYAEFLMQDGIDLLSRFPIIGEEYIEFEFVTPGFDTATSYKLHVYEVSDVTSNDQTHFKNYILKCCSEEVFTDATTMVNKKFKDECSNIVSSILKTNVKTKKKINYETTKGIQELTLTSINPFLAIDNVRRKSVSKTYKSSSFVFFENKNGYNFATIEFLFDKNKKNIGDKIFYYDSNANESHKNVNFRNIIGYKHIGRTNTIQKLKLGAMFNQTKYFDILTGDYKEIDFSMKKSWKDFKYPTDKPEGLNSSNFLDKYDGGKKFQQFIPVDSSKPNSFLPDMRGALQGFIQQILQNMVLIHIYGDSVITIGDVITCNLPNLSGVTEESGKDDRLIAGNYLVSKVRHMIQNGPRWKHTMSLELINATYQDKI